MADSITTREWNQLMDNLNNIAFLENKIKNNKKSNIPCLRTIGVMLCSFQLNLLILRDCVKKNNLGLPVDIWNIIFTLIKKSIFNYNPVNYNSSTPDIYFSEIVNVGRDQDGYDITYHFRGSNYGTIQKGKNITDLEKIVKIGQLCSSGCCRVGYLFYIIVDINQTDKTIACIREDFCTDRNLHLGRHQNKFFVGGPEKLMVQTYDEFIGGYDDDVCVQIYRLYYPEAVVVAKNKYPYLQ